jgi:hypothetical protein
MEKLGAKDTLIDEVCDIIGHHHHPRDTETLNFKILYDADLIANLEDQHKDKPISSERLSQIINNNFFTEQGRNEAKKSLLK